MLMEIHFSMYLSIKSVTWGNNSNFPPHPSTKFIIDLWKLDMRPEIQIFAWKLIQNMLPTRANSGNWA